MIVGLASELGYLRRPANGFQRLVQRVAATAAGAWFFSKTMKPLDVVIDKLSGGRFTGPELLAGLPIVWVTTTGRRSGQPRSSPLLGVPIGDDLAFGGTNFGQRTTPAWALNLETEPHATVRRRGVTVDAIARVATPDEREAVWATASTMYSGVPKYRQRITTREVRIFVLESSSGSET